MRLSNTLGCWSDLCERSVLGEVGDGGGCVGKGVEENATILCPRYSNAVGRVMSNTHHWCTVSLEEGITIPKHSSTVPRGSHRLYLQCLADAPTLEIPQ